MVEHSPQILASEEKATTPPPKETYSKLYRSAWLCCNKPCLLHEHIIKAKPTSMHYYNLEFTVVSILMELNWVTELTTPLLPAQPFMTKRQEDK